MNRLPLLSALVALAMPAMAASQSDEAWVWNLPKGFPKPYVPADNPMMSGAARNDTNSGGAGRSQRSRFLAPMGGDR